MKNFFHNSMQVLSILFFSILMMVGVKASGFSTDLSMGFGVLTAAGAFINTDLSSSLLSGVKFALGKPGLNAGQGIHQLSVIYLFDWDDVQVFPQTDDKGALVTNSITMKSGKYMIPVYFSPGSLKFEVPSDGEVDSEAFTQKVMFNHPGTKQEKLEFENLWLSQNIGILYKADCNSSDFILFGERCAPLRLKSKGAADKDKSLSEFEFASANRGGNIKIYQGSVTEQSPLVTVAYASGNFDLDVSAGSGRYKIVAGGAAREINSITGTTFHGQIITIYVENSGSNISLPSEDTINLKDGVGVTLINGREITLRCFKSHVTLWLEVSRVV